MSTIKWKFNVWTIAMFVGCLALSIVITQPLLARADNEWWNDVIIDTTFSDAKNMSLDTLNVLNSMNVWNSKILDWKICYSGWACLDLNRNIISLNKIRIWSDSEGFLISGNQLIYKYMDGNQAKQDIIIDFNKKKTATIWTDADIYSILRWYNVQEALFQAHLFESQANYYYGLADYSKPLFATKTRWYEISFKTTDENDYLCDATHPENEWTMSYREDSNWSQLIMCMKIGSSYSWVVIKDTHNFTSNSEVTP